MTEPREYIVPLSEDEAFYGFKDVAAPLIRCKDCIYYDPPHVEDNGKRYEYKDMPEEAFDSLGTGLVSVTYGTNIGGRCCRDYHRGYPVDKRVFVQPENYCGRAERNDE